MYYIGIDWADQEHHVYVTDDTAALLASFKFSNTLEGFQRMEGRIKELGIAPDQCLMAIEKSAGLLFTYLLERGYTIYSINPKAVDRYRDRFRLSGSKSDPGDALVLANILRTDRHMHYPFLPSSPLTQELRLLTRDQQCLVWQRTRMVNQITACLKDYYPGAVNFFSSLDQPLALAFLLAFPTPDSARQLSLEQLRDFCFQRFYRDPRAINILHKKIQAPTPQAYPWTVRAKSRYLLALLGQLASLQANVTAYEREIEALFCQHEDHGIFQSLPGAGTIIGARLLAEIGDCRDNFPTAASLQVRAGTAPVTKRSGQYLSVVFRRSCSKRLRDAFQQFAKQSLLRTSWAREYYNGQRQLGHFFSRAVRALANRWAAILWTMWQKSTSYDETYHQANKARHLSRLRPQSVVSSA
jgi:transposase